MVEAVDHDIKKLKRIRIESIMLGDLSEGQWRHFTEREKRELFRKIDDLILVKD